MAALLVIHGPVTAKHERDDEILVSGQVIDASGAGVAGAAVELHGTHLGFSLRDFRIKHRGSRIVEAETDSSGSFELRWRWHPYYNRFDLVAGVRLGPPKDEQELLVLGRTDISRRMQQEGQIVATVEIADASPVASMREFLSQLDSADQRQVYQETGKPDKVRHTALATGTETSWWYFELGKVYRFRDGETESVEHFQPILGSVD